MVNTISRRGKLTKLLYRKEFSPQTNFLYKNYNGSNYDFFKLFGKFIQDFYKNRKMNYLGDFQKRFLHISHKNLLSADVLKSDTNILITKKHALIYTQTLIDEILTAIKKGSNVCFIPLKIFGDPKNPKTGHANMLIFYIKQKKIFRYEPYGLSGKTKFLNEKTDEILTLFTRKEFALYNFDYGKRELVCPQVGPQHYENLGNFDSKTGFCAVFSYLFVVYTLDYRDVDPGKIMRMLDKGPKKSNNNSVHDVRNIEYEIRAFLNIIAYYDNGSVKFVN